MAKNGQFEASASVLGYLYQFRKALHCCVDRYGRGLDWCVAIEAGDDVEEVHVDGRVLYQLKHRAPGVTMTDYNSDLWKSLRIWSEGVKEGEIDLGETDLFLLTTASVPDDSVGSFLQPESSGLRDEEKAIAALDAVCTSSSSQGNRKSYNAYGALAPGERLRMVAKIQIVSSAGDVMSIESQILERLVTAVGHSFAKPLLQRLEGWFFQRALRQLRCMGVDPITGAEFDEVFTDLRDQFRPENLPIDEDIANSIPERSEFSDKTFVRQLGLANLGMRRIENAVRDYMRAFTQRSRWSEENLLQLGEISKYERRLIEEWDDYFAEIEESLGAQATEIEKVEAAKKVYAWATRESRTRIRSGCDEAFIVRGSYHILADDLKVGWHVDFEARLMMVLEQVGGR